VVPHSDGMDVVIFDIDEKILSNLPCYWQHQYGHEENTYISINMHSKKIVHYC
jgi:hypothetical protein